LELVDMANLEEKIHYHQEKCVVLGINAFLNYAKWELIKIKITFLIVAPGLVILNQRKFSGFERRQIVV
jgi:hypothetical protein